MLPDIVVNDDKCGNPLACRLCLLACPSHVLGLGTDVPRVKFKETDPIHFVVRGVRFQYCTGCMDCVRVCPRGAIQVSFAGGGLS